MVSVVARFTTMSLPRASSKPLGSEEESSATADGGAESEPGGHGPGKRIGLDADRGEESPPTEGSPDPQHGKKRTRASKPKVRTGCITCKIRRVKCGEEKPACVRCTSTGRTCDGYDSQSTAAKKRLQAQNRPRTLPSWRSTSSSAGSSGSGGGGSSGGLRALRPLVSNIEGTDTERMYFHAFRRIAEEGVSQHVSNATDFWRIAVPQMCLAESPVKHAFVALGAALQSYQNREREQRDKEQTSTLTSTEVFMLDNYSKALSMLYQRADSDMPDRINVTLLCCLAFVYIETLRDNWRPALTHLANGLRIVATLPDATLAPLADLKKRVTTPGGTDASPIGGELDYMLRLFATLEISACLFAEDFTPVISLRLLEMRRLDETPIPVLETLGEVHRAIVQFCRDLFALAYKARQGRHDPKFWEERTYRRELEVQLSRMQQMQERLRQFANNSALMLRPPQPPTAEYCSILLDLMHFKCCEIIFDTLRNPSHIPPPVMPPTPVSLSSLPSMPTTPAPPTITSPPSLDPNPNPNPNMLTPDPTEPITLQALVPAHLQRVDEIICIAELLKTQLLDVSSPAQQDRWFMLDIGIVPPMHFIYYNCPNPHMQARALAVMRGWPRRENLWDGDAVGKLVRRAGQFPVQVPRGMFTGAIPALYERLADLKVSDED